MRKCAHKTCVTECVIVIEIREKRRRRLVAKTLSGKCEARRKTFYDRSNRCTGRSEYDLSGRLASSSGSLSARGKTFQTRTARVIPLRALIFDRLGRKAVFQCAKRTSRTSARCEIENQLKRPEDIRSVRRDVARRGRVPGSVNRLDPPVLRGTKYPIICCSPTNS